MCYRSLYSYRHKRRLGVVFLFICASVLVLTSCGAGSGTMLLTNGKPTLAAQQSLTIPLIGMTDTPSFNPTDKHDASTKILMNMLYSGLVRTDRNLQVIPDQATWTISANQKQYIFHLKPQIMFGDGSPVTAHSYVDSWTYAARPSNQSPLVSSLMYAISGARDVHEGHTQTLTGVKALDDHTLQVTLDKPAPYFLAALAEPLFVPINPRYRDSYDQKDTAIAAAQKGLGSGPFVLKDVTGAVKMTLVPNTHYYGHKLTLQQVNVYFVNDPRVAYIANRAGRYDLDWDLEQQDQQPAVKLSGFMRTALLQTDTIFFDTSKAPFNSMSVRQAFARALDKKSYAHTTMQDSVAPAETLLPPEMLGYQQQKTDYAAAVAQHLLKSAYPDMSSLPTVTFSYPISQLSPPMAQALQGMWQKSLGIQVNLRPLEDTAYQQALANHDIQFGFVSWRTEVADPYFFAEKLLSSSQENVSQWHDAAYDQLIAQAENTTGNRRLALFHDAEQKILTNAIVVPLDHQRIAALIPNWLQGVSITSDGLYFGNWSDVAILNHKE